MDRNTLTFDLETAVRYGLDSKQSQIWTAFPAIITAVNLAKMTCEAVPAIKGIQTDEKGNQTPVLMPKLVDMPICFPSAGGFTLTLPIAVDDEILVVIANRCIDAWWQLGKYQKPLEARMHDLSDGFAIPGPRSQPRVVPAISSVNAQLRNDAGTVYLEITPGGRINLVAPSGIGLTGNVTLTGNLSVTGTVASDGPISSKVEITAKTASVPIAVSTHKHPGVTVGGGTTGASIP